MNGVVLVRYFVGANILSSVTDFPVADRLSREVEDGFVVDLT